MICGPLIRALPWRQVPAGVSARETEHGRAETRILKTAHVSHPDFPHARQAIKITRGRQDTVISRASRQTAYAAAASGQDSSTPAARPAAMYARPGGRDPNPPKHPGSLMMLQTCKNGSDYAR